MKTIGILGGMSWESSLEYYRLINEMVAERLGGLASAKLLMYSVNFEEYENMMRSGDWGVIGDRLAERAKALETAGAECMLIATNTVHKVAGRVREAISAPLLHIADAAGREIKRLGHARVALLGTKFTMLEDFYSRRLKEGFGVDVLTPDPETSEYMNEAIFGELCKGVFKPETRGRFLEIIEDLAGKGARAAVLGCTEIPLLIKQEDTDLPLIDTTFLHARMAVDFALAE